MNGYGLEWHFGRLYRISLTPEVSGTSGAEIKLEMLEVNKPDSVQREEGRAITDTTRMSAQSNIKSC